MMFKPIIHSKMSFWNKQATIPIDVSWTAQRIHFAHVQILVIMYSVEC